MSKMNSNSVEFLKDNLSNKKSKFSEQNYDDLADDDSN